MRGGPGIRLQQGGVDLTERQRQVLRLIASGKTNGEIGQALGISLDGAKWHVSEILAKLDVGTREEAAEWWRRRERLLPRLGGALHPLAGLSLWKLAGGGAVLAMAGAGLATVVALRSGSSTETSSAPATASAGSTSADADPSGACGAGSVTLTVSTSVGGNASSAILHAAAAAPCFLDARVTARVIDPAGAPLPVVRNGLVLSLRSHLPTSEHVGGVHLSNWCGDQPPARFEFTFESQVLTTPAPGDPGCQPGAGQASLNAYFSRVFEHPPPSTPPAGLTAITRPPDELRVHVYPDAPAGDGTCASLVNWMIPSTAAADAGTVVRCSVTDRLSRYWFAAAPDGSAFLDRVGLLLPFGLALPQPDPGHECDDLRDWAIPTTVSAAEAAWIGVCDARPLARGAASRGPIQVWARIPEGSPTSFPPGTPCWQLSVYLGSQLEGRTIDVQCLLE